MRCATAHESIRQCTRIPSPRLRFSFSRSRMRATALRRADATSAGPATHGSRGLVPITRCCFLSLAEPRVRIRQLPRTAQPLHRPRETEATHPGRHPQAALQPNGIVACTPQWHCSRAVQVGKRTCCGCSENCATSESSVACKSTANGTARWSGVIVSVGSFERVRGPVHRTSLRPLARTAHGSARPFGAGRHSKDRYNRHHCAFGRRVRRRSVAVLYEGGPAPRWRASACSLLVARGMPREGRYKRSSHWPGPERLDWAACAQRMTEVCAHMRESQDPTGA
jgi:hypothetical protein